MANVESPTGVQMFIPASTNMFGSTPLWRIVKVKYFYHYIAVYFMLLTE